MVKKNIEAALLFVFISKLTFSELKSDLGAKRLPGAEPPAGPPKTDLLHGADVFSQNLVHHAGLYAKRDFCITHRQAQRIHSWIGLNLI